MIFMNGEARRHIDITEFAAFAMHDKNNIYASANQYTNVFTMAGDLIYR